MPTTGPGALPDRLCPSGAPAAPLYPTTEATLATIAIRSEQVASDEEGCAGAMPPPLGGMESAARDPPQACRGCLLHSIREERAQRRYPSALSRLPQSGNRDAALFLRIDAHSVLRPMLASAQTFSPRG